jgi:hypothetical protein
MVHFIAVYEQIFKSNKYTKLEVAKSISSEWNGSPQSLNLALKRTVIQI